MAGLISTIDFQHQLVLQAWQCLIGDASVTYVSGPITTGLRWLAALEANRDAGRSVIDANCETIRRAARTLRLSTQSFVLEPASLHVEGWSQDDYLALWTTLIEQHASKVVFVEGWSYSIGCALEYERAVTHDIATVSLGGVHIARSAGTAEIRDAAADVADRFASVPKAAILAERLAGVAGRLEAQL